MPGPTMPSATMRIPPAAQLAIIGAGTLVVQLDTMVNVAFPHIVEAFGIAVPTIQWVVICYVLVHASLMLVCGRLGDLFGYRRVFLIGCAWSAVAFVLCATAQTYAWLLAARGMQGVGAALVLSVGPALATGAFAEAQRARVLGLYTMMFAIGSAAGPVLAGALIGEWGWSAVYAIRVPVALVAFALAWLLPRGEVAARRAEFDVIGGVLLFVAMTSGLLALDQLQVGGGPVALLLYASGAAVAAATFVRQQRRVATPLIALRHFRDMRLVRALVTVCWLLSVLVCLPTVPYAGFVIALEAIGPKRRPPQLVADDRDRRCSLAHVAGLEGAAQHGPEPKYVECGGGQADALKPHWFALTEERRLIAVVTRKRVEGLLAR